MAQREQSIHFASVRGHRVAWAAVGSGPPLVVGGWWMSHLELDWRNRMFRDFIEVLAVHRTVIRYDRPGTGLSDRTTPPPCSLDDELQALTAVIEAADARPAVMLGGSMGGPLTVTYAAICPENVERLILYGSYTTGSQIAAEPVRDALMSVVSTHWGLGSRLLADVFMPGADADERAEFARFQRDCATADVASHSLAAAYSVDVGDAPERVQSPTLVIHRRDDTAIPFALGRDLASRIPHATFVPLGGREHFPWRGDAPEVARAILTFLDVPVTGTSAATPPDASHDRTTTTALSKRELEVLRLVASGLSDAQIASELVVSTHTVHRHIANIRTKLGVPSRAAAAAAAVRTNLI